MMPRGSVEVSRISRFGVGAEPNMLAAAAMLALEILEAHLGQAPVLAAALHGAQHRLAFAEGVHRDARQRPNALQFGGAGPSLPPQRRPAPCSMV
jgi:hypothetical protein